MGIGAALGKFFGSAGGASLLGNAGAMIAQGFTNRRNRKFIDQQNQKDRDFAGQMFWDSRQFALDDWQRNNEYNSPQQQMQRLKEAGLNPHLVYGQGADNTAVMVRGTNPPAANSHMPPMAVNPAANLGNMVLQYQQAQQQTVVTDNLKEQARLLAKEAELKDAMILKTIMETDSGKFNLGIMQQLKDNTIRKALLETDLAAADLEKRKAETKNVIENTNFTIAENARKQMMQGYDIAESIRRAAKMEAEIAQMKMNTAVSAIEKDIAKQKLEQATWITEMTYDQARMTRVERKMAEHGVFKNDPFWVREVIKELSNNYAKSKGYQRMFEIDQEHWEKSRSK